jgi:uncharacterized protein YkwD/chitodextrinase
MHERSETLRRRLAVTLVVALAGIAAVAAVVVPSAGAVTNCSVSSSWGTNRADLASQVVALVNQHRASIGRSQLSVSSSLTAASTWKSLHMAAYGYFAHDDPAPPVARSAYQRARDCGYGGSSWGENIAWGYTSAQSVVNGWLGSPGHRSNIESASYTSTGVGVAANASGQLIWTQNFGNDSGSTPPPPPPPPPPSGDTQKPTQPTGLALTSATQTSAQIRWNASSDNVGVTSYGVYVGGTRIGSISATSATITGLRCGTSYAVGVDAADAAQNRSAVTTLTVQAAACSGGGADTTPPTTPSGLTVTSTARTSIGIRWLAATDNVGVASYRLWRGTSLVGSTTSTSFTFTGLACGTSYQLGVEARDAAGNTSSRRVVTVSTRSCFSWF